MIRSSKYFINGGKNYCNKKGKYDGWGLKLFP